MDDKLLAKRLVLSWARYTIALSGVEQQVLNELALEPAAHQEARSLIHERLGTFDQVREVALRMALAEFQTSLEHL